MKKEEFSRDEDIYEAEFHITGKDDNYAREHHDNSVELIQTWSSGGHFIVKNNIFPIKPGRLILINAMENHYSKPDNPDGYIRSKIIVATDFFDRICELADVRGFAKEHIFDTGGCIYDLPPEDTKTIDSFYLDAAEHFHRKGDVFGKLHTVRAIVSVLTRLTAAKQANPLEEADRTAGLLAEYVSEHSNDWENLSPDRISASLHISQSRVSHLFRELMGKTVTEYKNELRVAEAKKLLLSTNLKVYEISDRLNFQHSAVFIKYFKDKVGCTPRQYRMSGGLSSAVD